MTTIDHMAELIHERCGFAPAPAMMKTLQRAVAHRCLEMGGVTPDDYLALLRVSTAELDSLVQDLIVPETFFFRYPESFDALILWVKEQNRPLRILSAACSTGEEVYTIAMSLLAHDIDLRHVVIEGWDLNPASIATAREGFYTANSFRSGSLDWREQFFTRKSGGWQAKSALRDAVRFRAVNLLDLQEQDTWDVIFCRNALIYFSPEQQRKVIQGLDRALVNDGILFLGPAEPPLFLEHNWASAHYPMGFACVRRKTDKPKSPVRTIKPSPQPRARSVTPATKTTFAPRRPAPAAEAPPVSELDQAQAMADEGRLDEAQAVLSNILRQEANRVDANFLMGVVEEARGRLAAAESSYRRVLFLNPSHLEALQHMKLLLRTQGRDQAADRLGQRAARHQTTP